MVLSSLILHPLFKGPRGPVVLPAPRGTVSSPAALFVLEFGQEGADGMLSVRVSTSAPPPCDLSPANGSVPGAGLEPGDPQTHLDDFTVRRPVSSEGCE